MLTVERGGKRGEKKRREKEGGSKERKKVRDNH